MTVTPLPMAPGAAGTLRAGLAAMHSVLDGVLARQIAPGEVAAGLVEVERLERRLSALRLRVVAAAARADVPAAAGQPTTTGWLAETTRTTRQAAAQDAALATTLHGDADGSGGAGDDVGGTRAALDDGALSLAHAQVIAEAMKRLPAGFTPEDRARCEARLVADARRYDPAQLRRHARRVLAEVEPDPVVVDAVENAQLVTEEDAALAATALTLHDNEDGTVTGRFTVPRLHGDILRKLLDAITAPRRQHGRRGGHGGHGGHGTEQDRLEPAHARGLAFTEILEHLPTDHLHGRATTQVTVVMDIDVLRGHLRAAGLDTDHPISAGEARRLACTSGLTPVVIGKALSGASRVLDLGRTSRLFTDAHRTATHAIHTHCAARGCTRPIAWCELHHKTPWAHGGRTDLREAVPLCGWHHRKVHDHRYHHDWHADGSLGLRLRT